MEQWAEKPLMEGWFPLLRGDLEHSKSPTQWSEGDTSTLTPSPAANEHATPLAAWCRLMRVPKCGGRRMSSPEMGVEMRARGSDLF